MAERRSYREGFSFGVLSFVVTVLIGLGGAVATARIYGVQVVGQYALVYAPTATVWFLSSVKEQAALVRELAKLPPRSPRITGLFVAVFTFSGSLTVVASTVAGGASYFLFNGPIGQPGLFVPACVTLAAHAVLVNSGWNLDSVFSAFVAGRDLFWIRLHQTVATLAVGVAVGLIWPAVWGLVIALGFGAVTSLLHRIVVVRKLMTFRVARGDLRDGFSALPDLLRFGLRIAPGMVFQGISNEVATWTLGVVSSVAAVGAYNRAWTVGRKFVELNWRIGEMLLPVLVQRRDSKDHEGFDGALVDTLRYATVGLLVIAAVGGGAATGLMSLFGPGFEQASTAFALILLMPAVVTASTIQSQALLAAGRPFSTTVAAGGRMVCTVVATVALVPGLGVTGAALGMIVGCLVDLGWKSVLVRTELSSAARDLWPYRLALALGLAFAGGFAVAMFLDLVVGGLLGLTLALGAGTVAYAIILVAVGGVTARDRQRIADVVALVADKTPGRAQRIWARILAALGPNVASVPTKHLDDDPPVVQ